MASLHPPTELPIRPHNKDNDWSSFCHNVFEQYLDDDDLFGLGNSQTRERSSSDDSVNLFDLSGSSEQSNQTAGTSPVPAWEAAGLHTPLLEAQQPKAQEGVDFWQKTLRALEKNAAESERKQHRLRTTKSHPDFLSLGGCPSPPAIPSSPTDQSLSVQRRRASRHAANGRKTPTSAARSVSRGRPSGIQKSAPTSPYATVRKPSSSPHKMMNPSRYRAGFKDVWADKLEHSPKKYQLRVPSRSVPVSPPPSARVPQLDDFAAFGSPTALSLGTGYDPDLSPLTSTFQHQARIHTPIASPLADVSNGLEYFDAAPPPPNPYAVQTVPLNDTSPSWPDRTSSLNSNRIGSFDFGFGTAAGAWGPAPAFAEPAAAHYTTTATLTSHDPFAGLEHAVLPTTEAHDSLAGLGISCDSSLVSVFSPVVDVAPMTAPAYQITMPIPQPYYSQPPGRLPSTPRRRSKSHLRSESPSPPITEPRSARRGASSSRSKSKHRRAKSASSTPRQPANGGQGGFVNFTPSDSNKILSGVAPSGSSKTKARREKEAADKRRRLSQAAVKAVVDAGGNLDGLTRAGLLV